MSGVAQQRLSRVGRFLLAVLLLAAVCPAAPVWSEPRKVTIAPAGSLLLPEGWTIADPALAAKYVAEAKESLGMPISSNTVFFAIKTNAQGEQIACIALERTQPSALNNNIIPLLTPEEKEEIYASMRLILAGAFKQMQTPMDITETTFKTFGRYHTLIVSMRRPEGHNPLTVHVVYYFLPKDAHVLTVAYSTGAAKELNPDFAVILDSFDPDSGYAPAAPPDRKAGENLAEYLGRVYAAETPGRGGDADKNATAGAAQADEGATKENIAGKNATKADAIKE